MKTIAWCSIIAAVAGTAWGASVQRAETPYWQATYKGAGQLIVQSGVLPKVDPIFDSASNFVHWSFTPVPTNTPVYGTTDAGYALIWVLNGDAKGSLLITPNTRQHAAAVQYFYVICSNSNMKNISIRLNAGSTFGTGVPLAGPTWSPFTGSASQYGMIICDGDADTISFNCDLYGTLLFAKSIKTLRLKNTYLSYVLTGTPVRRDIVVAGTVTNNNVFIFSGGSIGSIVAKRMIATPITVGAPLLNGYMDEMAGVYTLNPPGGPIGSLTADEIRGVGMYEDGRWRTSNRYIPNLNTMILSTGVGRLHVKRIITQNTSVYIHN
ncbi:MAG: hypothetical protein NTV22_03775 [bacterium]|nr:hypothetical protein [bacterium]